MKRKFALLGLLIIALSPLYSLDFVADYIDGYLDVKAGNNWSEVYIGDSLAPNAMVRLDENSYAEISYGTDIIKLSRPGTYELRKLFGAKSEVASSGMGSLFSGKFKTLIQEDSGKTQTTVGGVRAAEAETVSIDWMSSETVELIADGKKALQAGNLEDAFSYFKDAYDFAADAYEEGEALYFIGLAHAMSGNYSEALSNLDMVDAEVDWEYYTDFYILKGQLLVESSAYDEAYTMLSGFEAPGVNNAPEKMQNLYFLLAVSANNAGEIKAAENALNKLIAIDSNSETAKAAKAYKNKL
jgi:tetratricopeptide (TPR) repeat protein